MRKYNIPAFAVVVAALYLGLAFVDLFLYQVNGIQTYFGGFLLAGSGAMMMSWPWWLLLQDIGTPAMVGGVLINTFLLCVILTGVSRRIKSGTP